MPGVYVHPRRPAATVPRVDAFIFDFDGVIADSEPTHERAIAEAARDLGVPISHDLYMTRIIGLDDRDTFRAIADLGRLTLSPADLARTIEAKQARVLVMIDRGDVQAFAGSLELARLAAASYPVAICSGAARVEIERILHRLGALELFRCIVTADDVPKAKPDPAGYLLTARKLGIDPARCVAIEDTPRGIRAAKAAGMKAVGVCHSLPKHELHEADLVAHSTLQLTIERLESLA